MSQVVRREPVGSLFDELFSDFFNRGGWQVSARPTELPAAARARMDVVDKGDKYAVVLDLPGVRKDDINVTIDGARVAVSAESKGEKEVKNGEKGLHTERHATSYAHSFQRPGSNHAEVEALLDARRSGHDLHCAQVYVTLEPCAHFGRTPPCATALIEAHVDMVIAAVEDPNPQVGGRGLEMLRQAGIDVRCGLLKQDAVEINAGFFSRMTRGRPWVRIKVAASLDGRTGLENGSSQWITSDAARADGHAWRARSCAGLSGIGTVRSDDPRLSVPL